MGWGNWNPGNWGRSLKNTWGMISGSKPAARPASQPSSVPQPGAGGPTHGTSQSGGMFGSNSFDPTYMLPQGGTYSAGRPAAPKTPGILTQPGEYETWYDQNKERLNRPTQGMGVMNEAADFFRQPNRTAAQNDRALAPGGYFSQPGYQEGYASRALPGLENTKSYQEQLYESGNQGLNTFYDRERDKRQERLENQMSAMGVFGSGATAKSMFELEAELGAAQARDMAGLAAGADSARMNRYGEARATAGAGDQGAINRFTTASGLASDADASVRAQGQGLAGVGVMMDQAEGRQIDRAGSAADRKQTVFQDRETQPLEAAGGLASKLSGLVERYTTASADEQAAIRNDIIQSLIASGTVDAAEAEGMAEAIIQGQANTMQLAGLL